MRTSPCGLITLVLILIHAGCATKPPSAPAKSGSKSHADPVCPLCSSIPAALRQLEMFKEMPPPRYTALSYVITGMGDRRRTDYVRRGVATNCLCRDFVNFLNYGVNPGLMAGYSDFLTLVTLSSNTLPVITSIHHAAVLSVDEVQGSLFPLKVGNTLSFRVQRLIRKLDATGADVEEVPEELRFEYTVKGQTPGHFVSQPPVPGPIFILSQVLTGPRGATAREIYYAPALGASVRHTIQNPGQPAGEIRLSNWR